MQEKLTATPRILDSVFCIQSYADARITKTEDSEKISTRGTRRKARYLFWSWHERAKSARGRKDTPGIP